jgi:hypothetical protein
MSDFRIVVVPDSLRLAIDAKLDSAIAAAPVGIEVDRDHLYQWMLAWFDEHGEIPDFSIVSKPT